jgi:hypothetical protein
MYSAAREGGGDIIIFPSLCIQKEIADAAGLIVDSLRAFPQAVTLVPGLAESQVNLTISPFASFRCRNPHNNDGSPSGENGFEDFTHPAR